MKKYLLFILLFATHFSFAQSLANSSFLLDKIPESGLVLDKGWKFHQGDNSLWASPTFNDQSWQSINPANNINAVPQFKNGNIGWLRLHLKVGKAFQGQQLSLVIQQIGASEIYLNGKFVYKYGTVSNQAKGEVNYDPCGQPVTLFLSHANDQLIAIRYSLHLPSFFNRSPVPLFSAEVNTPTLEWAIFERKLAYFGNSTMLLGVFFIISVLHFFLYLSYRKKKANLYFSLYTFFVLLMYQGDGWIIHSAAIYLLSYFLAIGSIYLAFIFYLKAVYQLFDCKKNVWYYFVCIYCITAFLLAWFTTNNIIETIGFYGSGSLVILEIIRVSILAVRKNIKSAKLFLVGQIISLLCFIAFGLTDYLKVGINSFLSEILTLVLIDGTFLIPPILLSYILAIDFSKTNISLSKQLQQVEALSAQNLAQEQEKQQLLALQNETLEQQVEERTAALKNSLQKLQTTQAQLIQSEKLASLGELTAGIAHEIQNPLNFVNNFSEVSIELLEEMEEELEKGGIKEASAISADIKQNLEKIYHHGKRADGIVKGMLQHSRNNSGERQLTDLNVLADEYLRLSYHGLRAKDKSFNATLTTHFQENLPKVSVVPQDIGRVLLNLFNNAFYAVHQKQKISGTDYKPEVTVDTSFTDTFLVIKVKDNGIGIPEAVKDKILQPFFTTKPTGEGTGLGLSLSYDIVVKGHGGKLDIVSEEGKGSEFMIELPIKEN